jgi:hypothetical protein
MRAFAGAFALLVLAVAASEVQKNPIRKVVTMLQDMQKSVEAEGKKEQDLFDKFMCYCSNGAGSLDAAIATSQSSIESLTSKVQSETALKSQLEQDVVQHKADREEAKKTMQESTTMREKEAAEFAASSGDMKANIASMDGALAALKKGLGVAMLQTGTGEFLRNLVKHSPAVRDSERETLLSFLDSSSDSHEAGSSDQIIGIVEQMKETMQGDLDEAVNGEKEAKASYETLTKSKTEEVTAAGKAIEAKTVRAGETAVAVTQAKADLEDTEKTLEDDTKFKASLARSCDTKQAEWAERSKIRAEEIQAISETVEMLNGDDALELFKKTLPSEGGALLQFSTVSQAKGRVASLLRNLIKRNSAHSVNLKMVLMMLKSKSSGGFDKVVQMVDGMIALLVKEQADDDSKKDYCHEELHNAEVEEKGLDGEVKDVETDISEKEDEFANLKSEIEGLQRGIQELDKMVTEATQQRKEEHEDYSATAASNSAALQLIDMAKNRMNKFYNPTLYKAPPTTTVSNSPYGFVQISQHKSYQPGQAPETFSGDYKKSEGSTGIIAMMSQMSKDVEMDIQEGKHEEATAQKDYVENMGEAAAKRAGDSKLIVEKEGAKATFSEELATARELRGSKREQLSIAGDKLNDLHRACDNFLDTYDEKKASRAKESDGLKESKSILAGATPSLVQK